MPNTSANATPIVASEQPARRAHHHRIGSFVGSLGRQGIQLQPSRKEREQARSLVFSDRLDSHADQAIPPTPNESFVDEDSDGDAGMLEEGVFAPSESQRMHRELQELMDRSGLAGMSEVGEAPRPGAGDAETTYGAVDEGPPPGWTDAVAQGKIETTVGLEVHTIVKNSIPLAITFFLQYSLIMSSLFSVGHLGKEELGAVSLGAMTSSITGIAFIQGMSTCLDTLCSQAYGAGRPDLVGLYFQKGVLVVMIGLIPVMMMWYRADIFLPYVVADEEGDDTEALIQFATKYLRIMILAMPGFTLFECGKRFLQSQNIFHASTIVLMVCAPLNILLTYTLVWNERIGLGFIGAPISIAITNTLMAFFLFLYVVFVDGKQCWNGFSYKVFTGWRPLIQLAIPGLIMVESEFLAYEIMTLASSYLGTSQLAAQTIMSSITSLAYEIPFAVGCAASTRVANFIGAGFPSAAKIAATVALIVALVLGLFDSTLIYAMRYEFSSMFTNDPAVISEASKYIPLCAIMHFFDSTAAVLAGVLRGQGRQRLGGMINLGSYYLIGVPMGLLLCFGPKKLGLVGIWVGFNIALATVVVCSILALRCSRWNHLVAQAQMRR